MVVDRQLPVKKNALTKGGWDGWDGWMGRTRKEEDNKKQGQHSFFGPETRAMLEWDVMDKRMTKSSK